MEILEVNDSDQWNRIVLSFSDYHLNQGYEWGEIRREAGWTPCRYAVLDGDRPLVAISAVAAKIPGVPLSVLYASRGPLMEWANPRAWEGLRVAIRELGARSKAVFLRVSPGVPNTETVVRDSLISHGFRHLPDQWSCWNAPRVIVTLPLNSPEQDFKQRMHRKIRRYLERAASEGAQIQIDSSAEALRRFYKLFHDAATRKGFPIRRFEYIESLRRYYLSKGDGCIVLVSYGGVDLSGLLFLRYGSKVYMMHLGNDDISPIGRDFRAGIAAHWRALQWARTNGCDLADWGGSNTNFPARPEDGGYSIYQFKAGFGSSLEYLTGYYDMVFRPHLYGACRTIEARLLPLAYRMRTRLNGRFSTS